MKRLWKCEVASRRWSSWTTSETRQVPEVKGLPIVGTMFAVMASGGPAKLHLYIDKRHKEKGPIFREKLGPVPGIFVSDGTYMRKIFAGEGKYPRHIVPESWSIYNQMYNCKRGLLFMDGEEWSDHRKRLNNVMLKGDDVDLVEAVSVVAEEMTSKWGASSLERGIPHLEKELYKWSLEVIVAILMGSQTYQKHRGDVLSDIDNLSRVVHQVFIESAALSLMPAKLAASLGLPTWRRFVSAVGSATEFGQKLLEKIVIATEGTGSRPPGLLKKIKGTGIKDENLSRIVTDLILAAGDTTSYTMQWLLHLLSVYPDRQGLIRNEVLRLKKHQATSSPLLKGALKEALRLYPVAPFITRYMPATFLLDGYLIRQGELVLMSLYTSGRDGNCFPDPNDFRPDRWTRTGGGYVGVTNPNASLPFAIGSRSCIGKKIAETQILVTLYHILKNYHVTTNRLERQPMGITLHLISVPESPINIILKKSQ